MKLSYYMGMIALLGGAAYAGSVQPVTTTAPQEAVPSNPWSIEISGAQMFAAKSFMGANTKKFHLAGPELTGVYALNDKQAFTLRGSALYGRHGHASVLGTPLGKLDLALMPGYRYTHTVSPELSVYVGANAGLLFTDVNKRHSYSLNTGGGESAWGFALSAELGVKYTINSKWSCHVAYQISGDTARPTIYGRKQEAQVYNGVRVGVGYNF